MLMMVNPSRRAVVCLAVGVAVITLLAVKFDPRYQRTHHLQRERDDCEGSRFRDARARQLNSIVKQKQN